MCPDIEEYAPLISATFGLEDDQPGLNHPGHRLRVRLADRSLRQTNPVLATVAALLELAAARVTASQVLDLASTPPVRRRFRFSDDDLERLQEWVATSGVRWGLDAAHREPFGLDTVAQNTWRAGLDRVLLGAAMAEDEPRWLGLALPLADHPVEHLGQPVDEFGQPAGQGDVAAVHVVERQRQSEPARLVLGHRGTQQHPVQPRAPSVLRDRVQAEGLAVGGVEPPAHAGGGDPLLQPLQVVVAEPEAAAYRGCRRQVQHLARGDPRGR